MDHESGFHDHHYDARLGGEAVLRNLSALERCAVHEDARLLELDKFLRES